MANDLQIVGIKLPNVVESVCPTEVLVDVKNMGPDPAHFPKKMDVCLDIGIVIEGAPAAHYVASTPAEAPPLAVGAIRTFVFTDVQFPCAPSASVLATADCSYTVPDNQHSAPTLEVQVPKLTPVPWLWTELRVGLKDSTGQVNWNPAALCPGATCVAEVSILNKGCADAPASITTLELRDGNNTLITSLKKSTPVIAPGPPEVVEFSTTLPPSAPGHRITLRGTADSTGVVTGQCNIAHLFDEKSHQLAAATGAPKLTFSATRPIFPGEDVPISWKLENSCADIATAKAVISYQGTTMYTGPAQAVGLQGTGREVEAIPVPLTVASSFYKIGTKKLTLDLTTTGTFAGSLSATALVEVIAEPAAGGWVFTAPVPGTAGAAWWKAPYTVAGVLTNPAHATMLPSSVVLNEVPNIGTPIPTPAPLAVGAMGGIVPGAPGMAAWVRLQAWEWLLQYVWIPMGPLTIGFTYTVTFALADVYGNVYPPATSQSAFIAVTVPPHKIAQAIVAHVMLSLSVGFVIAAILVAMEIIVITAVVAVATQVAILLALAGLAATASKVAGEGALDPPVPNFDYHTVEPLDPPVTPVELSAQPSVRSLLSVVELVGRINSLTSAMTATEARLIGARIDREQEAIRLQSSEYRAFRDSLIAAAGQLPLAVLEAIDGAQEEPLLAPLMEVDRLQQQMATWSRRRMPARARATLIEHGLPEQQLDEIEQAMRHPDFELRPLDALLNSLTQGVAQLATAVRDDSEAVLNADFEPPR